ncbi:T9SS type A sorting domain-containing protein [Psychroflexus aestuariivivens]|uniref:T9SS type A sorting domain-containing protein n=1 Tax=Psychroflexus aestuariivivens TaxID=1795040 RepID=UPI000FD7B76D|nr:T9SS type A sorting domain-containing protein [Psychroflexus aestuariivivens]
MKKITILSLLLLIGLFAQAQCPVPDGSFLGGYFIQQQTPIHPENGVLSFEDQVVLLSEGDTPESRVFSALYLEDLGIANQAPTEVTFTLDCGDVIVDDNLDTTLTCDQMGNITLGSSANVGTYDENDDTSFTLIISEYQDNGGCNVPTPLETTFTLTKLNCNVPENIEFSNTTLNSVDVNWTDSNGANTTWEIEYGSPGFELGSGLETISNITNTNETIDNLTENTSYEVYIRANCDGASGDSPWVGPASFNTDTNCGSLFMENGFPVTIGFDDSVAFQNCYTIIDEDGNGNSWIQQEIALSDVTMSSFATNGTNQGQKEDYLISPAIPMLANATYDIDVTYNGANNGANGAANEAFEMIIATDNTVASASNGTTIFTDSGIQQNGDFANVEAQALNGTGTFTPNTTGDYYIVFKANGLPGPTPSSTGFLLLFDFTVSETLSASNFETSKFTHFYKDGQLGLEANQNFENVIIYNMLGQEMINTKLSNSNESINVSNLSNGMYITKVTIGDKTETFKFIKK